jgi:ABC-2 type transport system permease protein
MRRLMLTAGQRARLDLAGAARDPLLAILVALMPLATLVFAEDGTPAVVIAGLPAITAGVVAGLLMVVLVARERFDGTLTRLRALPRGIAGYIVGRTAAMLALVLIAAIATIAAASVAADMALPTALGDWTAITAGVVMGAVAWAVIGIVAAAVLPSGNPMGAGSMLAQTVILGILFASANFQPVDELSALTRAAVLALPSFWSGHLVRQGLLGDAGAVDEPGGVWQPELALAIIVAWIVIGGLLAAWLLRRGARRGDGRPVTPTGRPVG